MKRHRPDALSLLFGGVFTVVGLVLVGGYPARGSVSLAWAGPAAAIAVAVLVVLSVRRPEKATPDDCGQLDEREATDDRRSP